MGSSDRRPWLSATVLNQALLDEMASNTEVSIHLAAEIEAPDASIIKASDRNKYVGTTFYRNMIVFPSIRRTIGEWLSPTVEFSRLELPLSNVDGRFNNYLPGGDDFAGWINRKVEIKVGIRDASATYTNLYRGYVTPVGGLQRDRLAIKLVTRDNFERLNKTFPTTVVTVDGFPDIEEEIANKILPVIYGDYTVAPLKEIPNPTVGAAPITTASVQAIVVNGAAAGVVAGTADVRFLVSEHELSFFDSTQIWVKRGDDWALIPAADVVSVTDNRDVVVKQTGGGGTTVIGPDFDPWYYKKGDEIWVRVKGKDLGSGGIYDGNAVAQAKDILTVYGGADPGDFDPNWDYCRDKAAPPENAIALIPSRAHVQEPEQAVDYALSLLEQVRTEMHESRDLLLKLRLLHFDEFVAAPSLTIKQWDLIKDTLQPRLDDQNIWNRVRGIYARDPGVGATTRQTAIFRNQAAIDQASQTISKQIEFPNLYVEADVERQVQEMLRLATGYPEMIDLEVTGRFLLLDVGDQVLLNVAEGSVVYENVPCLVRDVGFDPNGKIVLKLWSLQMTPFPGWASYPDAVGGSTAVITKET